MLEFYLLIGALALLWGGCALWQWWENRRLEGAVSEVPRHLQPSFRRILRERSTYMLGVLAVSFVVSGVAGWQWRLMSQREAAIEAAAAAKLEPAAGTATDAPAAPPDAQSAALDELKQRYEGLFVNYLILRRCGKEDSVDYHVLNSALLRDLASAQGPARLQREVFTAAQGTYNELYANARCDGLEEQAKRFHDYIATLMGQGEF